MTSRTDTISLGLLGLLRLTGAWMPSGRVIVSITGATGLLGAIVMGGDEWRSLCGVAPGGEFVRDEKGAD